jgi:hypothetical protein
VNTLNTFYDFLSQGKLHLGNIEPRINAWTGSAVAKTINELSQIIQRSYKPLDGQAQPSIFNFEANNDLSGDFSWCAAPLCRLRKADSLARFASLYSDTVYIANPFDKYSDYNDTYFDEPRLEFIKKLLIGDLSVLLYLRPLFEADLLSVRVSPSHICYECINDVVDPTSDIKHIFEELRNNLRPYYYNNLSYRLLDQREFYTVIISGSDYFIDHGETAYQYSKLHHPDLRKIARSLRKSKSNLLSHEQLRKVGVVESLLDPVLDSLLVQSFSAKLHHTNYLTNRPLEIDLINQVGNKKVALASTEMLRGIEHSVPNIEHVPIERIISLRQNEYQAFLVYRDALNSVLKASPSLETAEISQMIDEVVRPEINKLEKHIRSAKRILTRSIKTDLILGTGLITVGLFAGGVLPSNIQPLMQTLGIGGGSAAAVDAIRRLATMKNIEEETSSPYYFLWKAKQTFQN